MTSITKAVIPAAGWGTRFLPMTKAQPKEMLPVVDKPVIQYVVEEAVRSGCDDILIITGRNKRAIEDHFDASLELDLHLRTGSSANIAHEYEALKDLANIHYIRQKEQKGLGDAIFHARYHCRDEPFAVLLGDTICVPHNGEAECTKQMIDVYHKFQSSVIVVEEVPDEKISDYGIIAAQKIDDSTYEITDIIEKPSLAAAPSRLGAIGRYLLTPDIFSLLAEAKPGYNGEIQLTDTLRKLKHPLGIITKCTRYDIGDKPGWMRSNIELTMMHPVFGSIISEAFISKR